MRVNLVSSSVCLVLVAGLSTVGLLGAGPAHAAAAAPPCQRTYSSGPIALAIPNPGQTVATIDVPEDGLVVSDVDVAVQIHHPFDADLTLRVFSYTDAVDPRAGSELFDQRGQGGDNLIGTVFDDEAAIPISWGSAPFTGAFLPVDRLSALDGFSGGQYRLQLTDSSVTDAGTLDNWSVTLTYASCDLDSDGVEDHADSCLALTAQTTTGCPLTSRAVTATYRHGKFRGTLSSPVTACEAGRAVTIWKVRTGADRSIGTATSTADGDFSLKRSSRPGKYYATSAGTAVTDVAECPAVTSKRFRIRQPG